ncbi:MAG: glycosyltransferase family 2 protein [Bdellovibrionales bacterium]|nr:glycosyltransferase family 2 protein [Bdellovibrionales bacterium]
MNSVSVVVPTLGNLKVLARCLEGLSQTLPKIPCAFEVLVITSGPNPTKAFLHSYETLNLRWIKTDQVGVNHKRNLGLVKSQSDLVLFIDDDCIVSSTKFFLKHIEGHKEHPDCLVVGGPYNNFANGFWSEAYAENQLSWQQDQLLAGQSPFLGGNLSLKTTRAWLRFNENISFGGSETELIRSLKDDDCHFEPSLAVDHYIRINFFSFLVKAFLQGRTEGYLNQSNPFKKQSFASKGNFPYDLIFSAGHLYGENYGLSEIKFLNLLSIVSQLIFGWPKSVMKQSPHWPCPPTRPSLLRAASERFWTYLKVTLFWRRIFRVWNFFKVTVFWHGIYPWTSRTWGFFKVIIFWNGIFKVWTAFKVFIFWRVLYKAWTSFKVFIFWKGLHPLFHAFRLNLWRVTHVHFYFIKSLRSLHFFYVKSVWPIVLIFLKPYFFLKYQWDKRFINTEEQQLEKTKSIP